MCRRQQPPHHHRSLTPSTHANDYLCIGELHDYKNLLTPRSIQDAAITPGSNRATDLHTSAGALSYLEASREIAMRNNA
jgi:hypothetical protein